MTVCYISLNLIVISDYYDDYDYIDGDYQVEEEDDEFLLNNLLRNIQPEMPKGKPLVTFG